MTDFLRAPFHNLFASELLVPIGAVVLMGLLMWLAKRIPALFYRPIANDYTATATVVTAVRHTDPALFRHALESWIINRPDRIIAVIHVNDTACMAVARKYSLVQVVPIAVPGKRPAIAAGVERATTEIVVLVDSDVIWEPDALRKIRMPFADPQIGGVGARQHMYPANGYRPTLWERMADICLDMRDADEAPALALMGRAVSCLSGRTAAYRTRLLQSMRDPFLNETFLGRPCQSGGEQRYTCLTLQRGYRTWYQQSARVYATFRPDFKGFRQQQIGWMRASFRADLRALWQGWVWQYPYLVLMLIDSIFAPFALLLGPIVLAVAMIIGDWTLAAALLLWWLASRTIKIMPHLARCPADLIMLPIFMAMTYAMALLKVCALFTINTHEPLPQPGPASMPAARFSPYATQVLRQIEKE